MDDHLRVGDHDRQRYIDMLRSHTVEGRLTLDEFSDRVGEVFAARNRGDLKATLRELPAPQDARAPRPRRGPRRRTTAARRAPLAGIGVGRIVVGTIAAIVIFMALMAAIPIVLIVCGIIFFSKASKGRIACGPARHGWHPQHRPGNAGAA